MSPLQCWKLRKLELGRHLGPCVGKSFGCWCCCVTGFQESYCYQLPGIASPFPGREWAQHQTAFATLGEQKVALVQYPASVANSMGIRAAIQFTSITSTKHRAHMQVSSSDHCERAILSTVSIVAKGQINEECLLCNVESWESLSLADTSDLVLGRALVADAAVWQASRNPIATSYQESRCLFPRSENEPSIKQLLPCSENKKFPSFNILPVLLIQSAFVQQSSSHQSPIPT